MKKYIDAYQKHFNTQQKALITQLKILYRLELVPKSLSRNTSH